MPFPSSRVRPGARLLLPMALALTLLLFVSGPTATSRLSRSLWNLGHLPLFALWTCLLLRLPSLQRLSFGRQLVVIVVFAMGGGLLVEAIQFQLGRSFDLHDLLRNLVGSLLPLAFLSPLRSLLPGQRRLFRSAVGLSLAAVLVPATAALADHLRARLEFPRLAGFEFPLELGRWSGNARFSRSLEQAAAGGASLKVVFGTEEYSGVFLEDLPGDWRGFGALEAALFNPAEVPVELHVKLFDQAHRENGQHYADRFNAVRVVPPGWSRLRIDLREAADAPAGRRMDQGRVASFGFFTLRRTEPAVLYLDEVRLVGLDGEKN